MPAWLTYILSRFAAPPAPAPSAAPSLAQLASGTVITTAEDVLTLLAEAGIPWAGEAEDLLELGQILVGVGLVTPGAPSDPDAGHHQK